LILCLFFNFCGLWKKQKGKSNNCFCFLQSLYSNLQATFFLFCPPLFFLSLSGINLLLRFNFSFIKLNMNLLWDIIFFSFMARLNLFCFFSFWIASFFEMPGKRAYMFILKTNIFAGSPRRTATLGSFFSLDVSIIFWQLIFCKLNQLDYFIDFLINKFYVCDSIVSEFIIRNTFNFDRCRDSKDGESRKNMKLLSRGSLNVEKRYLIRSIFSKKFFLFYEKRSCKNVQEWFLPKLFVWLFIGFLKIVFLKNHLRFQISRASSEF